MATDFEQRNLRDFDTGVESVVAGRIPPQDVEAEKAVLGAILMDKHAIPPAIELLQPDYFYSKSNERIFAAILALYSKNTEVEGSLAPAAVARSDPIQKGEERT